MTTTAEPSTGTAPAPVAPRAPGAAPPGATASPAAPSRPERASGITLLGPVRGSGYRDGAALVRRADGQMLQLGPLMYAVLETIDGRRDPAGIALAASEQLGRRIGEPAVVRLLHKLAAQGLLAGTESAAPPRRNPLLALRWKVLVTNPRITRAIAAPFTFLFRPWLMWPMLAAFGTVCWFVLFRHGVAAATAQAFADPGLLLLVFALTIASAALHEIGHAAACRYGGATPGGMGMGLYLVWPAFYTDVTDAYRLDRRSRLRVDLAGLYFNAVIAVVTMAVWLAVRVDALLLLVALQILLMVKQLSPVIRADGYHILADATGVPDLYAHLGPTMRRLLPGHRREPSALTGKARALVTLWVLVIVPVLLSLMFGAVLVLPRLMTSAWDSGSHIVDTMGHGGGVVSVLAGIVRLLALILPVVGSLLVTQRVVRTAVRKASVWSAGHPGRRAVAMLGAAAIVAGLAGAWWPAGQYRPVRPGERGTVGSLVNLLGSPRSVAAPVRDLPVQSAAFRLAPGRHMALSAVPVDGASPAHPALFLISGGQGQAPVAILAGSGTPRTASSSPAFTTRTDGDTTIRTGGIASGQQPIDATALPFRLPAGPGPHGTQALAVGTKDGGVTYDIAYAVVTVRRGAPVDETNTAYAMANCHACTTVAVSFQVVLVVGQSNRIAPIDAAGALNAQCPSCITTAIADQIVVTLKSQPSKAIEHRLEDALAKLRDLPELGSGASPAAIAAQVAAVQQQVDQILQGSGLLADPLTTPTPSVAASTTPTGSSTGLNSAPESVPPAGATSTGSSSTSSSTGSSNPSTATTSSTTSGSGSPSPTPTSSSPSTGSSTGSGKPSPSPSASSTTS